MSVEAIDGVAKVAATSRVAPVEKTNVKNEFAQQQKNTTENNKLKVSSIDKDTIKQEIDEVNNMLRLNKRHCEFRYVEEAGRVAIKVVDDTTDEVIKEIPSEELLKTFEKLRQMTGVMVDEQR